LPEHLAVEVLAGRSGSIVVITFGKDVLRVRVEDT